MDVQWIVITKKLSDVQMKTVHRERVIVINTALFNTVTFKEKIFFLKIQQLYFLLNVVHCQSFICTGENECLCVTGISTKNTACNKCYYNRNQRRIYVEINKCALPHVQ